MRGLEGLAGARARLEKRRAKISPRLLVEDEELGRLYRAGDMVKDSVTGGQGRVERVEIRRVIIPVARG